MTSDIDTMTSENACSAGQISALLPPRISYVRVALPIVLDPSRTI